MSARSLINPPIDAMIVYEAMLSQGLSPSPQLKRILVEVCNLDKLSVMLSS